MHRHKRGHVHLFYYRPPRRRRLSPRSDRHAAILYIQTWYSQMTLSTASGSRSRHSAMSTSTGIGVGGGGGGGGGKPYIPSCLHACMHACPHVCLPVCMYACMPTCLVRGAPKQNEWIAQNQSPPAERTRATEGEAKTKAPQQSGQRLQRSKRKPKPPSRTDKGYRGRSESQDTKPTNSDQHTTAK